MCVCLTVPHPLRKLPPFNAQRGQTVASAARARVRVRPVPSGASDSYATVHCSPAWLLCPPHSPGKKPGGGCEAFCSGLRRVSVAGRFFTTEPAGRPRPAEPLPATRSLPTQAAGTRRPGLVSSMACSLQPAAPARYTHTHSPHTTHTPHTHDTPGPHTQPTRYTFTHSPHDTHTVHTHHTHPTHDTHSPHTQQT